MTMYIRADDFLGILSAYYSETLKEDIRVYDECRYEIEEYFTNERRVKKVRFLYDRKSKIYNRDVTQSIELDEKEIKKVFSTILKDYNVISLSIESTESDLYSSIVEFIGVELTLKEKQKELELTSDRR